MRWILCWAAMGSLAMAADRPTADSVMEAVKSSRASFAAKNPPPTPAEIQARIKDAESRRVGAQRIKDAKQRADVVNRIAADIKLLRDQLADAKSGKNLPVVSTQLDVLNVREMPTGSVGVINRAETNEALSLRCVQILGPRKALMSRESSKSTGELRGMRPVTRESTADFILIGLATDRLIEGKTFRGEELNVVVTGRESFETVGAGTRTVPVLEVFNPDEPFK